MSKKWQDATRVLQTVMQQQQLPSAKSPTPRSSPAMYCRLTIHRVVTGSKQGVSVTDIHDVSCLSTTTSKRVYFD